MRRCLAALAAVVLLGAAHGATPGVDAPPPPQPPRPVVVPPLHQHRLPNGVTVVIAPRHQAPVVTLAVLVRAGPELDPAGRSGTAAMTAALLGKGARRHGKPVSATELARQAEALGTTLDAGSGSHSSTVSMTVTAPKLDAAAALLADVVRRPTLAAAELERLRAQSLDALRVTLGDPAQVSVLAGRRQFWGDSAYGRLVAPATLKRITRADVAAFHAAWYRPERAVVVLAGDVDETRGRALAERLFGDWRMHAPAPSATPATVPQPLQEPLLLIDMPGSGQSGVMVTAPFVATRSAERRMGQVANAVLGGGYSARLNQEVRIKRGLSYGAFSETEVHPDAGMLHASTQTNHPTAVQVLELLRGEIARLAEAPPSADELAARQATLVGSFSRRLETTGGLASLVLSQLVLERPLAELSRAVDEIMAVKPEQVQAFAKQHWQAGQLRGVIAGDLKAAGDSLKPLGDAVRRIPIDALDLEQAKLAKPAK